MYKCHICTNPAPLSPLQFLPPTPSQIQIHSTLVIDSGGADAGCVCVCDAHMCVFREDHLR